jgi:hypothetical protein
MTSKHSYSPEQLYSEHKANAKRKASFEASHKDALHVRSDARWENDRAEDSYYSLSRGSLRGVRELRRDRRSEARAALWRAQDKLEATNRMLAEAKTAYINNIQEAAADHADNLERDHGQALDEAIQAGKHIDFSGEEAVNVRIIK